MDSVERVRPNHDATLVPYGTFHVTGWLVPLGPAPGVSLNSNLELNLRATTVST
jgi:hypothetical protein